MNDMEELTWWRSEFFARLDSRSAAVFPFGKHLPGRQITCEVMDPENCLGSLTWDFNKNPPKLRRTYSNLVVILRHHSHWHSKFHMDGEKVLCNNPRWDYDVMPRDYSPEWSYDDTTRLQIWFERNYSLRFKRSMLLDAVSVVARAAK